MPNPFTLSFGKSPLENISRTVQINTILDAFRSDPINQQIFMITGVRGSGKTVLLTEVENRLEKDDDWIVVELNPAADLLSGLAAKLSSHRQCADTLRFLPQLEMRPSSNAPSPVESREAPPTSSFPGFSEPP